MTIGVSPSFNPGSGVKPALAQPDAYLAALLSQRQVLPQILGAREWLQKLRDRAAEQVRQSVIPSTRHEEWRFTDLSPLRQATFQAPAQANIPEPNIAELILPDVDSRLVFVNGLYAPHLSSLTGLPAGVFVGNLAQLPAAYQEQIQDYLAQQQNSAEVFTALNTAGFVDAAVIWVSKNEVIEQPIQLLFVTIAGESPIITQPRCLVVAETSSALTLIEEYTTVGRDATPACPYWTNGVTEIWLKDNAQVNHSRIQREHQGAFHVGRTAIAQAQDSRYTCNAISLGAGLSRHNLDVLSTGEQTETTLNGLSVIGDTQLADTHSAITFTRPYGKSDQLHKCIVNDRAHAVFNGKVFVPQAAQLTDAAQLNRNLLLSPKARMDTKPQLEIVADNVKCTHGATVGQLDPEEVFYLQSRGLDSTRATNLLIRAFAAEVIERLPILSLRQTLTQSVMVEI